MQSEVLGAKTPINLKPFLNIDELTKVIAFDNMAMLDINDTPVDHHPPPLTLDELQEAHKRGDIFGGIFDLEDKLRAYYWFIPRDDEMYVSSMAVDPGYRDRGISQQILALADEAARGRRLNRCTLSVDPLNGRGISAYLKSGYKIVGYKDSFFGQEYPQTSRLLMEKQLDGERKEFGSEIEVVEIICDDEEGLKRVLSGSFIGISLIRSEDKDNKKNKIVFKK